MQPTLLYYANLLLCGVVFLELLIVFRKNPVLHLYFLLIVASLFAMNYFALKGIDSKMQFMFAKFMRFVYVCITLLALIHLVHGKIPRWFIVLVSFAGATITGLRIAYYNDIKVQALPNVPNHVFTIGSEFTSPRPGFRYLVIALAITAIIVGYYYYRRLLMKLDRESDHFKYLSRWVISFVVPFFLLAIFGTLGNLRIFDETLSSILFAFFNCIAIISFIIRPRFLTSESPELFQKKVT